MSVHTSTSPSPGEPSADSAMPSSAQPSEALSATAAAASGTLDSSAFQKERRSSISMKRHHDEDVDYEKEDSRGADIDDDDDSNRTLRETRTTSTAAAAAADTADAVMTGSPVPKKKRISVQLPEQIRAQKQAAAAAAAASADGTLPPKPERTSSITSASPPTTPHTTPHTPIGRRLSMTEDQKRASFTLTIAKALQASYPLSPITNSSPTAVSPHIQSIASSLEESLYSRHAGLTLDYTTHVRDVAFNLTHSTQLARRIVDGRVSIERVSGMNWKEFADGEVQREREERKEEDLVAHLAPVDVTPGILPNAKTVER